MHIVIPDDYQDAVRGLACFSNAAAHEVTVYRDTVTAIDELAQRFARADCLVLIRERTRERRQSGGARHEIAGGAR